MSHATALHTQSTIKKNRIIEGVLKVPRVGKNNRIVEGVLNVPNVGNKSYYRGCPQISARNQKQSIIQNAVKVPRAGKNNGIV